jgi:putative PIN family toxin of toxin-antitoxin system
MLVVADTNIIVSGLLWRGSPRRILDAARAGDIKLFTTAVLPAELEDVLSREKFAEWIASAGVVARDLVLGYAALVCVIEPTEIEPVILADP